MTTAEIVAVKIIDIDESDTVNPRGADSYGDFMKEISALRVLSENKARNINHVIEALQVGHTVWMVTEYCGGSVATLVSSLYKDLFNAHQITDETYPKRSSREMDCAHSPGSS